MRAQVVGVVEPIDAQQGAEALVEPAEVARGDVAGAGPGGHRQTLYRPHP
jgi:hypothetical protein